jgi:hypothetical protein
MGSSRVYTRTVANPQDLRVQVEGGLGVGSQFIAPAATVANPGGVASQLGNFSTLHQSFSTQTTGLPSEDVRQMLLDQELGAAEAVKSVTQLSSEALASMSATVSGARAAGSAVGVTSEPSDWSKYIPIAVVAVAIFAMTRRKAA